MRAQVANESNKLRAALDSHPEKNKKVLQQKLIAGQLSLCMDNILETQVDTLQGYKGNSEEFTRYSSDDYASLIAFDLASLTTPVTLTEQEVLLTYELEEATEKMKLESSTKPLSDSNTATIAGFDFASMGRMTSVVYILIVVSMLAAVIAVLIKAAQPEPDFNKQRREKLESRKKK